MAEHVRIMGLKEPYLTYRTRRLLPGGEMDVPPSIATILLRRGLAKRVERVAQPPPPPPKPSIDGDDVSVLKALAKSMGVRVDGRWSVARLKNEIAKKR